MSKRIVVGLDPSEYSKMALQLACARAALHDGTVIGVGIIDRPGIENAALGAGVGASHYSKRSREHHIQEATDTVTALLDDFEGTCQDLGVAYERVLREGDPVDVLVEEAKAADLIIIGTRSYFHFETQQEPGDTLHHLLKSGVCPVIVVPKELILPFRRVIIPYDGSKKAARSMRAFIQLTGGLPVHADVILLRVDEKVEDGLADLERPSKYLRAYGLDVECRVVPGDARKVILEQAKAAMPSVVVLGASGKSSLRVFFFGSVTQSLLEDGDLPLFVTS